MAEGHEGEWVEGCGSHLCKRKMGMGTHGRGERSVSTERQGRRERQDSRERFQDAGKGLERGEGRTKSRRKANKKKEEEDGRGRGIAEKTERTQKDQSWER